MKTKLIERIQAREAVVGVVGLGYVGLPLLLEFARKGFKVVGFDVDESKVEKLHTGQSYIRHIGSEAVAEAFKTSEATTDFSRVAECDAILICVPTPLTKHRDPDLSYIEKTAHMVGPYLRKEQLVTLESTTYPGTTEDVLTPILESESGLSGQTDFMVAYSPEREDPNNKKHNTATIPKVVGGLTADALAAARELYDAVICQTVPVSNCRTAEATKLMENIFRCINIALVNELKMVFAEMDIDVWEVVRAASTKPFGFMPFFPGPGLGGHCIPIDPFYLTWKAKEYGMPTKFIELAGEINTAMPEYVAQRTLLAMNDRGKTLKGSRLLLVGLAYKKNVDDDRESPTFVLWNLFKKLGADVDYFDPFCPVVQPTREHSQFAGTEGRTWDQIAKGSYDVAVISTAHDDVDHDELARVVDLVVDARGVCADAPNVVRA